MRVLFTLTAGTGSLQPLIPVALALSRAGHEVAWCSSPAFRDEAEATGFAFLPAGTELSVTVTQRATLSKPLETIGSNAWAARAVDKAPDIVQVAQAWKPDVIVRESWELAGCAAAESLGIPHASIGAPSHSALDVRDLLADAIAEVATAIGLVDRQPRDMLFRYLHLCFAPKQFDGPGALFPSTAHFLRHTNPPRPGEQLPEWLADIDTRPIVLTSLGTIGYRTPGLNEAILAALRDEPINLIMAVGREIDPASFGPQPPNVHMLSWAPQALVLAQSTAFVTHGGFNGVKEAMSFGVPMVVLPIFGDQFYSAVRCTSLGLADVVAPDQRTPERIRRAVRTVINTPSFREQAMLMRNEMEALPGPERAVALLERLVRERRPILRQD